MFKKAVTGIFALTFTGYVSAATTTYTTQDWDLRSSNSDAGITGRLWNGSNLNSAGVRENDNSQINLSDGTVNVKVTAWSSTGEGVCGAGAECGNGISRDDDPFIERAILTQYSSGIGAINRDEGSGTPDHSLDNRNGDANSLDFDMVLFEFDTAVELTGYRNGYGSYDEDFSIVGYTGTGTLGSTPFSSNTKWSDLLTGNGGDWGFTSQNFVNGTNTQTIAPGFESRYWLIGAYNPVFTGTNIDHHNDAIKLRGITTRQAQPQTQIPEPTTLALMLAGVAMAFRRKFAA